MRIMEDLTQMRFDSLAWLSAYPDRSAVQKSILAIPPANPPVESAVGVPLLHALLLDPVFQLK